MKVDLPIEQWNALDQSAVRNIELLTLARQNIAMTAKALADEEAKAKAKAEAKAKKQQAAPRNARTIPGA